MVGDIGDAQANMINQLPVELITPADIEETHRHNLVQQLLLLHILVHHSLHVVSLYVCTTAEAVSGQLHGYWVQRCTGTACPETGWNIWKAAPAEPQKAPWGFVMMASAHWAICGPAGAAACH